MGYGITIRVRGDYALFTRPEMKVERVSYDVITPSAARGVIEAVYWKPAIRWVIDKIHVLNEIEFTNIRRNEVSEKVSDSEARRRMNGLQEAFYLSAIDARQQRAALVLKNVDYAIEAHFELTPKAGPEDTVEKHYNIILRRLRKGQHFSAPYLGTREFGAKVELIEADQAIPKSLLGDDDLGWMLYDLDFSNERDIRPQFFKAEMRAGVIDLTKVEGAPMILQALTRYYDILAQDPQSAIAPPGYSTTSVSFALNISAQGELLDVFSLLLPEQRGKKSVDVPRRMIVPEQVKRASNVLANFLCDNSTYVLGISDKNPDKPEFGRQRFEAFRQFHKDLLATADCDAARAVLAFLDGYDPRQGREHPAVASHLENLLHGGNLVFMFRGAFVQDDPTLRQAWDAYKAGKDAVLGQCLVTGETAPIARLHPSLKNIRNANPTGASLVGFNAGAYESYNREQGQNSPVSEKAAFAYTTALNHLLSPANPNKKISLGDTTVVYWAESGAPEYADTFARLFEPEVIEEPAADQEGRNQAEARLGKLAGKVKHAQALDISRLREGLDDDTRFYVLGLAPNAARIAVRFFLTEPFGKIIARMMLHYRDLELAKEYDSQPTYITVGHILDETVSKKSKDKDASPLMAGAMFRAILSGAPYPAALYYAILNRIRADVDDNQKRIQKINYVRAAVIKAFLIRKYRNQPQDPIQEALSMSLNEQSTLPAYVLGRLFAVLEKVQQDAIGSVNASIKDRYFTSACASPASVFPVLLRLSQHHINKAEYGRNSDRRIQDILGLLDVEKNPIPARLTLDEQGIFVLGYYHQRAALYVKSDRQPAEVISTENE